MAAQLITIADPDDPRVASFRDVRDRDLRDRDGLFIAEGKVVLSVLFDRSAFEPHALLLLDSRLEGMKPILAKVPASVPVYVAAQTVLDGIAGFHLHRGVLGLVRRAPPTSLPDLLASLPPDCTVPVLVGISNHDNVGAIFRNAAAFDAAAVLLDATSCDPLYRKAIRVSVGATLAIPYAVARDTAELVRACAEAGFRQYALSPGGTRSLSQVPKGGRVALYLGTEGDGLPDTLMTQMQTVRIAMSHRFDSLNVAAASAIALSHFYPV